MLLFCNIHLPSNLGLPATVVNILRQNDVTIMEFGADYSPLGEPQLGNVVQQLVEIAKHAQPPLVVMNLSNIEALDSYFVQFLIRIWKLIKKREGQLVLAGLNEECLYELQRSKIEALWHRFDDVQAAVEFLKK